MRDLLTQLLAGRPLSRAQTVTAFHAIMSGQAEAVQVAALLALIQQRGPSVDEIAGAAQVMRQMATPVVVPPGLTAIDTCGTGGDHSSTFNISTAAALVVAGAGRPRGLCVAKHGNRSITSQSGSSQVLEALGMKLEVTGETLTRCLDEAGLCFCFAPAHHPAMKHAMPIRRALGVPTLFNVLGPLTNPAGARRQLMGVFDPHLTQTLARVLGELGAEHALVVHGQGVDELVTWGTSQLSQWRDGKLTTMEIDPVHLGLAPAKLEQVQVADVAGSAAVIRQVLAGAPGAARDLVCLNAGAALWAGGVAEDLSAGLELARAALDSGAAQRALDTLVTLTQRG